MKRIKLKKKKSKIKKKPKRIYVHRLEIDEDKERGKKQAKRKENIVLLLLCMVHFYFIEWVLSVHLHSIPFHFIPFGFGLYTHLLHLMRCTRTQTTYTHTTHIAHHGTTTVTHYDTLYLFWVSFYLCSQRSQLRRNFIALIIRASLFTLRKPLYHILNAVHIRAHSSQRAYASNKFELSHDHIDETTTKMTCLYLIAMTYFAFSWISLFNRQVDLRIEPKWKSNQPASHRRSNHNVVIVATAQQKLFAEKKRRISHWIVDWIVALTRLWIVSVVRLVFGNSF